MLSAARPTTAGLAHGKAGMGWALLRLAAAGGARRYEIAGRDLLRRAAACVATTTRADASWCRGRAGIALAVAERRTAGLESTGLDAFVSEVAAAVADRGPLPDHSLCHGEVGALELLGLTGGPPLDRVGALLASLDRAEARCATPDAVPSPGLLTGLAGIGHGLLRLGFGPVIPSVLLLQSPGPTPTRTPKGRT